MSEKFQPKENRKTFESIYNEANKNKWEMPEQCNITSVALVENSGATIVEIDHDKIKGESNSQIIGGISMRDMISKIFELMVETGYTKIPVDKILGIIEKYNTSDIEDENYDWKFKVTADDLVHEGIFSDKTLALSAMDYAAEHFLNQKEK